MRRYYIHKPTNQVYAYSEGIDRDPNFRRMSSEEVDEYLGWLCVEKSRLRPVPNDDLILGVGEVGDDDGSYIR